MAVQKSTHAAPIALDTAELNGAAERAVYLNGRPDWSQPELRQLIDVSRLRRHPFNPRTHTSLAGMHELIESIKANGVLKSLMIIPAESSDEAFIISGHRRHFASIAAGLSFVPCALIAQELNEAQVRELLVIYNEHNVEPAPVDAARSYYDYMKKARLSTRSLARELSIPLRDLQDLLRLLELPAEVQKKVNLGQIEVSLAQVLVKLRGREETQIEIANRIVKDGITRAEVEHLTRMASLHHSRDRKSKGTPKEKTTFSVPVVVPGDPPITVTINSERRQLDRDGLIGALKIACRKLTFRMPDAEAAFDPGSRPADSVVDSKEARASDGLATPLNNGRPSVHGRINCSAVLIDGAPNFERSQLRQLISIGQLWTNPFRQRVVSLREDMELLQASVEQLGMLEPIKVARLQGRDKAYIVSGHRRLHVARQLGWEVVPCELEPEPLSELAMRKMVIICNKNQLPPAPIDRVRSYRDYARAAGISESSIAKELNISRDGLSKLLRLLDLPESVQADVNRGEICVATAFEITKIRGGKEAQEYVAGRVKDEGLTQKDVAALIAISKRSVAELLAGRANHANLDGTRRTFHCHRDPAVRVAVRCDGRHLNDEELVKVFDKAVELVQNPDAPQAEVSREKQAETAEPETLAVTNSDFVPVDLAWKGDLIERVLSRYLPKYVSKTDQVFRIRKDIEKCLTMSFTNEELMRLGLTGSHNTQLVTCEWLERKLVDAYPVMLLQVMVYWQWCLDYIEARPNKRQFTLEDLMHIPLDTVEVHESKQSGYSPQKIADEIRRNLKKISGVIEERLLFMLETKEAASEGQLHVTDRTPRLLTAADLSLHGYSLTGRFMNFFMRWNRKQGQNFYSTNFADETPMLELGELARYSAHCLTELIRVTAGRTDGRVGRVQLEQALIPYSGLNAPESRKLFSTSSVLSELETLRAAVLTAVNAG